MTQALPDYLTTLKEKLEQSIEKNQEKYTTFPEQELQLLESINQVLADLNGSGGGGITQSQVKTATKEAIQEATNLLDLPDSLEAIATQTTLAALFSALSPVSRTPALVSRTDSGSVTGNSVAIANTGSAAGTIEGTSVPAGFVVRFQAPWRDTVTVDYDATGTTFLISSVS
jgi:hypothetical protein